jgi:hypothetical protein
MHKYGMRGGATRLASTSRSGADQVPIFACLFPQDTDEIAPDDHVLVNRAQRYGAIHFPRDHA